MDNTQPIQIDENVVRQEIFGMVGAEGMSPEMQEAVLVAAGSPILQSVMLAILLALPDEEQEKFKTAIDAGDENAVQEIISANIPDSTTFIGNEVRKAAAEFKTLFEQETAA